MKSKKTVAILCAVVIMALCAFEHVNDIKFATHSTAENAAEATSDLAKGSKAPRYIFLFIGDGMSYPQIESTNYYLCALKNKTSMGNKDKKKILKKQKDALGFLGFPVAGSAQTYDSTSFCPDSSSSATAIATGHKTYSGMINMNETATKSYETIAEKLHKQLGYKVGIVSSANLNHATPASFYSHQKKRSNYYAIGRELIKSGFEYFAGGKLSQPKGKKGNEDDLYKLAEKAGYTVAKTQKKALSALKKQGKAIIVDENLDGSSTLRYEIDRSKKEWSLSDYVSKGIDYLSENNDKGFFMMVEGGKIDWACHANDAATAMADTKAFSDAVNEAVDFYKKHSDETLILVTGDHETGGMTIGYAGTSYDTFLQNLSKQKLSFKKFNDKYVSKYKKNNTSFKKVMKKITQKFGLITEKAANKKADSSVATDSVDKHPTGVSSGSLVLTEYELQKLKDAYKKTMSRKKKKLSQKEYELYGSYEPLTVTITHLLNNKSGISFTTYSHTGLPVPVFAKGVGQEKFGGYFDNTDIYKKMAELTGVK